MAAAFDIGLPKIYTMAQRQFPINAHIGINRHEYDNSILLEEHLAQDPFRQFETWLNEALDKDPAFGNAVTLSTVDSLGMPDSRVVLLRNVSYGGLTFYTNYKSKKGRDMAGNPNTCLLFFWKELMRQVKVQGHIAFLPEKESDAYFAERPFESRVGAWVSRQSEVVKDRQTLSEAFDTAVQHYAGKPVPRPSYWGGYVLIPRSFEFWQGGKDRIHDRLRYTATNNGWMIERLMP